MRTSAHTPQGDEIQGVPPNAAGWIDEQVVVDGKLLTRRKADDQPAVNEAILRELSGKQAQGTRA
ncbi:hypothetical protein [Pseudoduganella sp. RAF53_2]|uniref:hypothetical protein n=1 Tax=unclassified Pseudoduganella TaxID=2637179 RepID=UPI003F9AFE6E